MLMRCPGCGETCETDADIAVGQHVVCPFCEVKFAYDEGCRVEPFKTLPIKPIPAQETQDASYCAGGLRLVRQKPLAGTSETRGCLIGCLPIVLPIIALFIIVGMHNWMSVLLSVPILFWVVIICIYARLGKAATISDAFKRLGIGGSSISLFGLTLACAFLMHSCDRQAKEDDFKREERAKEWRAQIERDGGWMITLTCPDCNFGFPYWIDKDNRPLYGSNVRCPNCGKYRTKCRW